MDNSTNPFNFGIRVKNLEDFKEMIAELKSIGELIEDTNDYRDPVLQLISARLLTLQQTIADEVKFEKINHDGSFPLRDDGLPIGTTNYGYSYRCYNCGAPVEGGSDQTRFPGESDGNPVTPGEGSSTP